MLSKTSFDIQPSVRTSFGPGVVKKLGKRVKGLGSGRAFIITDPGIRQAGLVDRLGAALEAEGIEWQVFDGVSANPDTTCVKAGAAALSASAEAVVIALGGGSAMDAAKAIALVAPNGGEVGDFHFGCKPGKPGHRIIAVPTTAGTGSETNLFGVVTDPKLGRKVLVGHASVLPVQVLLDPELTLGVPPAVTATTGMDVLTHAIEAFTSSRANPFSDAIALQAISMVVTHLPVAFDDGADLEARSQMLLAANLAGISFGSSGLGICHAMGHPLSARLGVAHGQSLATLLPHVMRFNRGAVADKYAKVAIAMGAVEAGASDAANADHAIAAVEALRARVGTDRSGKELGIEPKLLPTLVEDAFADLLMMTTPKHPEPKDVTAIYEAAL